jgi:hypothetical protein
MPSKIPKTGPFFSFESYNYPGSFIRHAYGLGEITPIEDSLSAQDASFELVTSLAKEHPLFCSFRSYNFPTSFFRHEEGRLKLQPQVDDALYREDASFKLISGLADAQCVSFESYNYPGNFIRHYEGHLFVGQNPGDSELFSKDATFRIVSPTVSYLLAKMEC